MNSAGGLAYDRYSSGGSDEWLMRIGPADAPSILFLPPLFEEMNRTRGFIASIMRALAGSGYGCWLPDLPGTGESERPLGDCSWESWRAAAQDSAAHVAQASSRTPLVASLRGGALLDDAAIAKCHWRFAPAEGASLARDMIRASMVKAEEMKGPEVELAGYRLSEGLLGDLTAARAAEVPALRTVRLQSDRNEADTKLGGPALWRRSEPGNDPQLAELIASDIKEWSEQCAAS